MSRREKKYKVPESDEEDEEVYDVMPDRSKSDFYCELCDSHMNSEQMWRSHIVGKRHLKNTRKEPGEPLAKIRTLKTEDVPPLIDDQLRRVHDPVIGLSYICELQRPDTSVDPMYTCYLCQSTTIKSQIIDHILSTKHRTNFFKEADPNSYQLIESMILNKDAKDSIVMDKAQEWESNHGRGEMEVKIEKSKMSALSLLKKRHITDCEDAYSLSKRFRNEPYGSRGSSPVRERRGHSPVPLRSSQSSMLASSSLPSSSSSSRDVNILRDHKEYPLAIRIRILEELSRPPITTETEARHVMHVVNALSQCLMQYKLRRLPSDVQTRIARELLAEDSLCISKSFATPPAISMQPSSADIPSRQMFQEFLSSGNSMLAQRPVLPMPNQAESRDYPRSEYRSAGGYRLNQSAALNNDCWTNPQAATFDDDRSSVGY